jgi:transcriptional regulator with XRE-family HTH domain
MKERLLEFLRKENKTSAQLADEIGVQASGISHILSGRNNPSLDFVLKMLEKYQFLSTDWLLFGKGTMYKDAKMQSLFDTDTLNSLESNEFRPRIAEMDQKIEFQDTVKGREEKSTRENTAEFRSDVIKIVWFYENNSFEEFIPRK